MAYVIDEDGFMQYVSDEAFRARDMVHVENPEPSIALGSPIGKPAADDMLSLLEQRADEATIPSPLDDFRPPEGYIGPITALQHSAVWSAIALRAGVISSFPIQSFTGTGQNRRPVDPTPPILTLPTPGPTGIRMAMHEFAWAVEACLCLRGNAYGWKSYDYRGRVMSVHLLHPDDVGVQWDRQRRECRYYVFGVEVDPYDVWHIRRFVLPGEVQGVSAITYARVTLETARGAQRFGRGFFNDGGHPTGLLSAKTPLDSKQADTARDRWNESVQGRRRVAVLGNDWTYTQIQISPEDSQFLATIGATDVEIARFMNVPGELIGAVPANRTSLTYQNRESRAIDFQAFHLSGDIVNWENSLNELTPRGQYTKADTSVLLRADQLTQAKVNRLTLLNGATNPDELRAASDRPPLPDGQGQIFLWPPQTGGSSSAGAGDTGTGDGTGDPQII